MSIDEQRQRHGRSEAVNLPEGVSVREEWAVHSGDGAIYRVKGDQREVAEREAEILRVGEEPEPDAAAAHRYVMNTPDGPASTGWRWRRA